MIHEKFKRIQIDLKNQIERELYSLLWEKIINPDIFGDYKVKYNLKHQIDYKVRYNLKHQIDKELNV